MNPLPANGPKYFFQFPLSTIPEFSGRLNLSQFWVVNRIKKSFFDAALSHSLW